MTLSIVFDLDGTLIDSYRDIAAALNDVLRSLALPERDPEVVKTMIGEGVGVLLERGLGSGDPELVARAKERFRGAYQERLTETTAPYAGIMDALRALSDAGAVLSIATNKPSYFTAPIVAALGLDKAGIRGVASADEAGARKPDPRVVALALERAGAGSDAVEGVVYVGDMPVDLQTARNVPCPCVGVSWGFDPAALRARAPDYWMESPKELIELVRGKKK